MTLSDATIRKARLNGKNYTLKDADGLALYVSASGSRVWNFRFYWAGRQQRMSFGTYPEIGLKEARARRDAARALVATGIDPRAHRRKERAVTRAAAVHTFKAVFHLWRAFKAMSLKTGRQSTLAQIDRIFAKDVLPSLGNRPIYGIKRPDLLDILAKIEQRKALTTAEKVRTWLNQMHRYALVKVPELEQNPASDLDVVAMPKPPVTHHPFLRMKALPDFLRKLRRCGGKLQTQLGLRLLLLTGVRTGELRLATPDQFDLERGLWTIPPEVVKQLQIEMRKQGKQPNDVPPYIVPLSAQAIEIVRHLLEQVSPAQHYLFAHRSDLKKRISENTLNAALRRMGYERQLTGHGMRATISTALNEIGYPKVWVDAQLSHADPDKVSSAYNHAEYVEQRRCMMQDWADRLDLWEQGQLEAAGTRLTIHLGDVATLPSGMPTPVPMVDVPDLRATQASRGGSATAPSAHRLPALPIPSSANVLQPPVCSEIQRERVDMLETYESSRNLPVPVFARLAGKSRDQINREIRARNLLTLSLGNRGQRIPDWHLDPLRHKLVYTLLQQADGADAWALYRALSQPRDELDGRSAVETVTRDNFPRMAMLVQSALRACQRSSWQAV